jgi:hypothetical protein
MGEKGNVTEVAAAAVGATSDLVGTSVNAVVGVAGTEGSDTLTMIAETAEKRAAERVVDRAEEHLTRPNGEVGAPGGDAPGA